ncbi:hypothetical protein Tco_0037824 [Tanacetum coccineum]
MGYRRKLENSNSFMDIIIKKRSQLSIHVIVFVEWHLGVLIPSIVKEAFKNHFEVRFQQPCHDRLKLNAPFHNRLSSDQVDELDRAVSRDEIRRAFQKGVLKDYGNLSVDKFFIGVVLRIEKISWVAWGQCLASKLKRGLGAQVSPSE